MENIFSIALDGPAGAGKSSIAEAVAQRMNAIYLNTGAMYRATGLYMIRIGVSVKDTDAVIAHLPELPLRVEGLNGKQRTFLGDEDVTDLLAGVSDAASTVSKIPEVRTHLVAMQREIAKGQSVIMDGRDIGTKVLPDATLKVFLTASAEERANRRLKQLQEDCAEKGVPFTDTYEEILKAIIERDYNDSHRAASPMVQADDAIKVDSTNMTQEEVVARIIELLHAAMGGIA